MTLPRLLRPASIAVFGGRWAVNVINQCRRMNYGGEILPVHPTRQTMAEIPCFSSIAELPTVPDAAFVGVNRHASVEVVRQLSAMGCGGVVCFASGYKEAGEEALQDALLAAAADMPVLGPNCYGFINYLDGALLWPDQQGGKRVERGVAIITQSSNIAINFTMQKRALSISYIICAGNQAQLSMAAIARGLLENPQVSVLGLHIEGIASPADFSALAQQARAAGKHIVVLKSGKSQSSRDAAVSHTASIAGDAVLSSVFLRRCGVAEVDTIPEFLETLKLLHTGGALRGSGITSMSCSGGEAGLVADAAQKRNIIFTPFSPAIQGELSEHLGPLINAANPLDYHTFIWGDKVALQKTFSLVIRARADINLLILDYPRDDQCADDDWCLCTDALAASVADSGARAAVVATLAECMPEKHAQTLAAAGITPFCGVEEALAAVAAAAVAGSHVDDDWRPLPPLPQADVVVVDEFESKQIFSRAGISVPAGIVVETPAETVAAAEKLGGMVALKALGITHKSEKQAVRLRLTAATIEPAAAAMAHSAQGFLVEQMVEKAAAEVLVGVRRDIVYGASLTVGSGGVRAELLNDTQTLILPTNEDEILSAFSRLILAPLLFGYRGSAAADVAAAAKAALCVSKLLTENVMIEEIEINPLLLMPTGYGAVAADALVRRRT